MRLTHRPANKDASRLYGAAPVPGVSTIVHLGNDYGWGNGWQVYAAASGAVSVVRWSPTTRTNNRSGGYGNYIIIDHGDGYSTLYAHLPNTPPLVAVGDVVTGGQQIGLMGNTGNASGAHLHFEVRLYGTIIDPNPLFGSATATSNTTLVEEDELTEAEKKQLAEIHWMLEQRVRPQMDDLAAGRGAVHTKLDLILWVLSDPAKGLRKMVADLIKKIAQ